MRARLAGTLALLVAMAAPAAAQQPQTRRAPATRQAAPAQDQAVARSAMPGRQNRGPQGPAPEAILRMKEQLSLTEAQVTRLEALRVEGVTAQRDRMAAMLELQSQLRAGSITPEQAQERRQAQAPQAGTAGRQALGERVRGVLTDQQRVRLAEMQVDQMRQQLQGRLGQMRSRAGSRGMQRGGQGMAPGGRGMPGGGRMMPRMNGGGQPGLPGRPGMQGMPGAGGQMAPGGPTPQGMRMRRPPAGPGEVVPPAS